MWIIFIVIGLMGSGLVYFISLYNNLVAVRSAVGKAWSNIDVLLKQRHDELPKLVAVCKQYQQFERGTLERITQARVAVQHASEQGDALALGRAEGALRQGVGSVFAVAEAYPELKTNESFMQLQQRISVLENTIADRRELYNDATTVQNVVIESFPDNLLATWFHFEPKPLLVFRADEVANPDLPLLFKP